MRLLDERECTLHSISGGVGGCPPPVSPPVSPPVTPPPPPAEPHLIGSSPGIAGSFWVSGALLRFRSDDGNEYGETGASQPTSPGAINRSVWITAPGELLLYQDDSGVTRAVSLTSLGAKPPGALTRAIRYDSSPTPSHSRARIQFAGATNFFKWHNGF